jgi:hypothetical protein
MADPTYAVRKFAADAAMLYIGGTPVGPSIGGYTHDPGAQWRVVEADGMTTEKVGMQRVTGFDTHLRGRLKDLTSLVLGYLMPGSTSDGSNGSQGGNQIIPTTARVFFTEAELIQDVRLIYRTHDPETGTNAFHAIVYPLMRPENIPMSGEDSNEGIRDIDWKAILLKSQSANEPPYFEVEDYDHDTFDIDNYVTYES